MSDTGSPSSEPTPEPPTNIVRNAQGPNDNWPDFSAPGGSAPPQAGPGSAPQPAPQPAPGPGHPPWGSGPAHPQSGPGPGYPQAGPGPGYGRPGPPSGPGQLAPYGRPGPPAPPGYPQQGYGRPGPGYPPPGYGPGGPGPLRPVQPNDTSMAMLAHLGAIIFGFIPGLIVYLVKKDESPWARKHAAEALNFSITMAIASIVCIPLMFIIIGIPLLLAVTVLRIVFGIMAGMAANRGETYEYPGWVRMRMFS